MVIAEFTGDFKAVSEADHEYCFPYGLEALADVRQCIDGSHDAMSLRSGITMSSTSTRWC